MFDEKQVEAQARTKWQAFLDYTGKNPGFWTGVVTATVVLLILRACAG